MAVLFAIVAVVVLVPVVGVWCRTKNKTALATCSAVTRAFSRLRLR